MVRDILLAFLIGSIVLVSFITIAALLAKHAPFILMSLVAIPMAVLIGIITIEIVHNANL